MAKNAARKYAKIIAKLGYAAKIKYKDFKIQSILSLSPSTLRSSPFAMSNIVDIVASCDVKFPVRLEVLAVEHKTFSSYEAELFPGLIYRMVKPKVVLLIFVSGKLVLTGTYASMLL